MYAEESKTPVAAVPRRYVIERIGSSQIVELYADGFESLTPKERIFAYFLSQAAIAGRDISIDQRHRNALEVRVALEEIFRHPTGIDPGVYGALAEYLKLFWENNGFYDSYTSKKFIPKCTPDQFRTAAHVVAADGAANIPVPIINRPLDRLTPVIFDEHSDATETDKTMHNPSTSSTRVTIQIL